MTIYKRDFGQTGLKISEIGLGTSQIANVSGQSPGVRRISATEAMNILARAIDQGINFFDTSDEYGAAESLLGQLSGSVKEKIFIATKAGYRPAQDRCFEKKYLIKKVEDSLKQLRVETIDLFQVNKPSLAQIEDDDIFLTLEQLKKDGKIKLAGMVVGTSQDGFKALENEAIDAIMVLYHLLYHGAEKLIIAAREKGLGVIVRSPFSSGLLTGKIDANNRYEANDSRRDIFTPVLLKERLGILVDIWSELAIPREKALSFALEFILANKGVSTVIPGVSSIGQLDLLTEYSSESLSADDLAKIHRIVADRMPGLKYPFQNL
jgi:aryl-alcohol dehydrogenase-like predicted oxidoreductase